MQSCNRHQNAYIHVDLQRVSIRFFVAARRLHRDLRGLRGFLQGQQRSVTIDCKVCATNVAGRLQLTWTPGRTAPRPAIEACGYGCVDVVDAAEDSLCSDATVDWSCRSDFETLLFWRALFVRPPLPFPLPRDLRLPLAPYFTLLYFLLLTLFIEETH